MNAAVFHRFDQYGPVCGTRDGVNAADMDPPEITCRRCWRAPVPNYWDRWQVDYRDGSAFVVERERLEICPSCGGGAFIEEADGRRPPCERCRWTGHPGTVLREIMA